jgi:allantoicase
MDFTELVDLASERLGGVVLFANDDFFAPKENLLKPAAPVFIEGKFTDRGKWMDGWETRRRRTPGFDWCIIRLGLPGIVRGAIVDTAFFKGNFPEHSSLEACVADANATAEELEGTSTQWIELLPKSALKGDSQNRFEIQNVNRFTHLRFKIFPDGGVARLRAYGEVVPDWKALAQRDEIDLAAVESGGLVLAANDMFFGSRHNLIMPGRGVNMGDGWETKRRRGPGFDWAILKLGAAGTIRRVEVDTAHFKGNFPESCSLEACFAPNAGNDAAALAAAKWAEVLPRTKLEADKRHLFEKELRPAGDVTHARFNIYPDGGVSRMRIFGRLARGPH